jgi:hypothetical protein
VTPTADDFLGADSGPVTAPVGVVVRLGEERFVLKGTEAGRVERTGAPAADPSTAPLEVNLAGTAEPVPLGPDEAAPVVTITAPRGAAQSVLGDIAVSGLARDDRDIAKVSWSLDGGPATSVPFRVDPMTVFVEEVRARLSFAVPVTPGEHDLRVTATDSAGRSGSAQVRIMVTSSDLPLPARASSVRTSKWGAAYTDPDGHVHIWGYGTNVPTVVAGVENAVVATPNLALLEDGTATTLHGDPLDWSACDMYCSSPTTTPVPIAGLTDLVDVDQCSTNSASYALRKDGTVWAWGDNTRGQLGDGTLKWRYPPVQVNGLPAIQAISAGGWHAVALAQDGTVWTWGANSAPDGAWERVPHQVAGIANATSVSASEFDRYEAGAAIVSDGTLWMWGDETSGQLGSSITERRKAAFRVPGVSGATSVVLGYNHALVLLGDGTVLARGGPTSQVWGYWGELGDGTMQPHLEFALVSGLTGVVQITAGAHTSHALLSDGTLRGWGENTFGTVGDGTRTDRTLPTSVVMPK